MAKCEFVGRRKTKICAGDLIHQINIQTRSLAIPQESATDFGQNFITVATVAASIHLLGNLTAGISIFDGINTSRGATHNVFTRWLAIDITSQHWIEFNGSRFDVVSVENYEERNQFLRIMCNKRGDSGKKGSAS